MVTSRDRILLVESDPLISDLIGRQALQASGYQVLVVNEATTAISKALQWSPDLIITNLNLPGLSGKDLLVALTSQGVKTPVIILAQRGLEADIMQTFRLGASDYLLLPVREAEVISAVERVLQQVHDRRERERLAHQLQQTNQELQYRVRELTTIFAVGKAVTSVTDQSVLLDKVLDGAIRVTLADLGWFLLREDQSETFSLVAERNLPASVGARLNKSWDDGISSLVAMSGEPLSIHGEPLKRFKVNSLGGSALIVPIKYQQKRVVGLLIMMRRQPTAFGASEQHLLEALADYASISLVNARLFKTIEERARSLQQMAESAQLGDKINVDILESVKKELGTAAKTSLAALQELGKDPTARWRPDQRQILMTIQSQLLNVQQVVGAIAPHQIQRHQKGQPLSSLNDQVRLAVQRMQALAQQGGLSLVTEMSPDAAIVCVESGLLSKVCDGLFGIFLRFSQQGALITIRTEKDADEGRILLRSSALTIELKELEKQFDQAGKTSAASRPATGNFSGLGIKPGLVKEIVSAEGGKLCFEGQAGKTSVVVLSFPLSRSI